MSLPQRPFGWSGLMMMAGSVMRPFCMDISHLLRALRPLRLFSVAVKIWDPLSPEKRADADLGKEDENFSATKSFRLFRLLYVSFDDCTLLHEALRLTDRRCSHNWLLDKSRLEARSLPDGFWIRNSNFLAGNWSSVEKDLVSLFFLVLVGLQLSSLLMSVRIRFLLSSAIERTASKDSALCRAETERDKNLDYSFSTTTTLKALERQGNFLQKIWSTVFRLRLNWKRWSIEETF